MITEEPGEDRPARSIAVCVASLPKLNRKQASDLVEAFQDDENPAQPLLAWEIERRLTEIKSTALAFRYLCPRNPDDARDALEGLIALCFRAKGNLYVIQPPDNLFHATRAFIQLQVLAILEPFTKKWPADILCAAMSDKFRYIPRVVRFRIIDKLRSLRRSSHRRIHGAKVWSLDFPLGEKVALKDTITHDVNEHGSSLGRAQEPSSWIMFDCFKEREAEYRPKLGESAWETLLLLSDVQQERGETRRAWKGRVTRLIAEKRGVNLRQARARKDELRRRLRQLAKEAITGDSEERNSICGAHGRRIYAKIAAK